MATRPVHSPAYLTPVPSARFAAARRLRFRLFDFSTFRLLTAVLAVGCAPLVLGGCATPMPVRAKAYDLHITLEPETNQLTGQAALRLVPLDSKRSHSGPAIVELDLNPALNIVAVDCNAAAVKRHKTAPKVVKDPAHHEGVIPTVHSFLLDRAAHDFTMTINYQGRLFQDAAAGEKRGEIHNFTMSAHVGTNGVYLGDNGAWYPTPSLPEDSAPDNGLADYHLVLDHVPGMEFVAGLDRTADQAGDGTLCWSSIRPVPGLALTGGQRDRVSADHGGIRFHALVSPEKAALADDILDCARQCYDRYVPLLGPYPFREFTVLESFFSSGFAFPGFTQFTPVIINDKKPYWRHGYLDHEFVHAWLGNGVYVDPRDGNWCESLTSYCTNLCGFELDGDTAGARVQRRNKCHFLSRLDPAKDKPLGTFGQKDGADRGIGYDKGCMVFHMLARTVGHDAFWAGMARFTRERMGKFTNWDQLQACFAAESKRDLAPFFQQWVRSGGTPRLAIRAASYDAKGQALELTLTQGPTSFTLDVPIRICDDEQQSHDVVVPLNAAEQVLRLPAPTAPAYVEVDPDYQLFRAVPDDQILPTSSLTHYGKKVVIVAPEGPQWKNYDLVASDYEEGNKPENTTRVPVGQVTPDTFKDTGVLILGDAVRHAEVQELLARAECPVTWKEKGFAVGDQTFDQPGQAVFVTLRHPDDPKRGITIYYGNDEAALANAGILGYYSNSLLVFGTASAPAGHGAMSAMGMGGGTEVLLREDLERRARIPVVPK